MKGEPRPPLRALLVGIDHYPDSGASGAAAIPDLRGCVRDVERMERFLRDRAGVPPERIRKLTSRRPEDGVPGVPAAPEGTVEADPHDRPTCEGLVAALTELVEAAGPGEEVLIHISAHGVRQATCFPELKGGERARDEAILPCDAADPHGPLLLDVVMAGFLHRLQERQAFVTLVLDTCHSGGALRSADTVWERHPGSLGAEARPLYAGSLSLGELESTWRRWREGPEERSGGGPVYRSHRLASGWIPSPRGYLLLAACGEHQRAYELALGEAPRGTPPVAPTGGAPEPPVPMIHGALSHFLLHELETGDAAGATWELLFRRVCLRVRDRFPNQSPRLEGEGWRRVLGGAVSAAEPDLEVLGIADDGRLRLAVGAGLGLAPGTLVEIRASPGPGNGSAAEGDGGPGDPPTGGDGRSPLLVAELEEVGASESRARIRATGGREGEAAGEAGLDRAAVTDLLARAPRAQVVEAVAADPAAAVAPQPAGCGPEARRRLEEVGRRVGSAGRGWLRWVPPGGGVPDFQVTVEGGELRVLDPGGGEIPLHPPLPAIRESVEPLVARLVHLARFRNVERLRNPDPESALAPRAASARGAESSPESAVVDPIRLELGRVQDGYREGLEVHPHPWPRGDGDPVVEAGSWVALTVANHGPFPVHLALLDLRTDRSIRMLLPGWAGCERFEVGTVRHFAVQPRLAEGLEEGRGHLKLLVTRDPTDFRWLALPALDDPGRIYRSDGPRNALERLFAALVAEARPVRSDDLASFVVHEWTTRDLRTRVVRRGSAGGGDGGVAGATAGAPGR